MRMVLLTAVAASAIRGHGRNAKMLTMTVFEFPPKESCSSLVSLEFL